MKAIFDRIADAYAAFNQRVIDRALSAMHADVEWENGMEGASYTGTMPCEVTGPDSGRCLIRRLNRLRLTRMTRDALS
jgi:hypothetical protein